MAKQTINVGSSGNDGTGDQLRTAFGKINANFSELYAVQTVTGLTITLPAASLNRMTSVTGVSGSTATAVPALSGISVTGDGADVGSDALFAFQIMHTFGGPLAKGGRQSGAYLFLNGATSSGNTNRNYVGWYATSVASTNDGGTDTGSGAKGAIFAYGGAGVLTANVTNMREVCWAEANVACRTGSSVAYKNIISLVGRGDDAVQGSTYDCMLAFSNQSGAIGFNDGILFGPMNAQFPIVTGGNFLRSIGGSVTNGIDISNTAISGSAFKSPGFSVNGTGKISGDMSGFTITADGAVKAYP